MGFMRRRFNRFRDNPASLRSTTTAIISITTFVVLIGAVIVWVFDREEYPTLGSAVWFTLQTVTTVGYGDATPERMVGRVVAGFVMITGIGLITVVSAAITSVFIEAARAKAARPTELENQDSMARLEATMVTLVDRLEAIESTLVMTMSESTRDANRQAGDGDRHDRSSRDGARDDD